MKKLISISIFFIIIVGIGIYNGFSQETQNSSPIHFDLLFDKSQYSPGEPIQVALTLRNVSGKEIYTSKGFGDLPFHLYLYFTDPDGKAIRSYQLRDRVTFTPKPPPVFVVGDELVQGDPIEILPQDWIITLTFDANDYYSLTQEGLYSVIGKFSMRIYDNYETSGEIKFARIDSTHQTWVIESNTVYFNLLAPSLDHITISPKTATIIAGGHQTFTVTAYDSSNNSLGDVTSETVFAISPDGNCTGATCTASIVGPHIVTGAYYSKTDTATLYVIYNFNGFFKPVDNLPTFNVVKAGAAVPVKFSLNGNQGLDVFAPGYPSSGQIPCQHDAQAEQIEETVTAGGSSLSYDPLLDQYIYVWKTNKGWANTCRQFIIKLKDGTEKRANFKFTK